jgi:hypothetical protein
MLLGLAAAALLLILPGAADARLRVLETDITIAHTADWRLDGASGRQAFSIATRRPAREAIDHLGAHPPHGAPPFTWMTSEDLTWHPPRGELRRSAGGAECDVTKPRVRMYFRVEGRDGDGGAPYDLQLIVGRVPLLDVACGTAPPTLALASPPEITLPGAVRKVRRLKRGRSVTVAARIDRGTDAEGRIADSCSEPAAAAYRECAVTAAEVRFKRVV